MSQDTATVRAPVYNDRGVIAETYSDLQGLPTLQASRLRWPLPKASPQSVLRAVFQSSEIAILNLSDLLARATVDLENQHLEAAVTKMFWLRGFARLLTRISVIPQQVGMLTGGAGNDGRVGIADSPAFQEFQSRVRPFEATILKLIDAGEIEAEVAIQDESLASARFNLLHLTRVCNWETTIWEHNLREVRLPGPVPSFEDFVGASILRTAVYERTLKGDSYFTQFRGLHQIPETLGEEASDLMEEAVRRIRADELQRAAELLSCVEVLADTMVAALPPMADHLATSDYHVIRENLGLTSGSHSVCLRFHMFSHLCEELSTELENCAVRNSQAANPSVEDALREAGSRRGQDVRSWLIHLIGEYCLRLRVHIAYWRDEHVNLPRNNLGGESTRSLAGSPDGLRAVIGMRDMARSRDPFRTLAQTRDFAVSHPRGALASWFDSPQSLDVRLLAITGAVTQRRFVQVQERLGFFANRCPFTPPPRRKP